MDGLVDGATLVRDIFVQAIRPDPTMLVWEWADHYRILEGASESGPWRTDRVPAMREVMAVLSPSDPTEDVTLVAGTQNGKTECGNNFIGFIIDQVPGPAMIVMPTSSTSKRSSRTRLASMIENTPRLRAKVSMRSRDSSNSQTMKEFPGGHLVLAGANSAADLKNIPIRFLFEDEIDEYPDDLDGQGPADKLAEKRTTTYRGRRKIYRCSSPTKGGKSKIWTHWLRSDQRRYYVPCPFCQHEQVLVWDQFRYDVKRVSEVTDADGVITEVAPDAPGSVSRETDQVLSVWYECIHCEGRIEEHRKTWMLERGKWLKENPSSPRAGFHLPSFYSPLGWLSWREVVEERLEADKDTSEQLLKVWMNTVAGLPFTARAETVQADQISNRGEDYSLGTVPAGGLMLTAAVDVQADRLEVGVKAWGEGEESWLVDYQVIFGDTENTRTWDELDGYLQHEFEHASGALLPITATGIDCGFRTQTVYGFCREKAHRNIVPVRGRSESGRTILGRPSVQEVMHDGKPLPEGVKMWPIGVDTAKQKIYSRLKIEKPGPGYMHFPFGLPREYYKGLTAERQVHRYVHGFLKLMWEKLASETNEPLDVEVYAYAMAILAGITRMDWAKQRQAVEALAIAQRARLEAQNVAKSSTPAPEPAWKRGQQRPRNWTKGWRH